MKLETKYFGAMEINEAESLTFVVPLYGFEHIGRYVLLYDDANPDSPFCWLQAVEEQDVCFVLTDPAAVAHGYLPGISQEDRRRLGLGAQEQPMFRLVTILPEKFADATVNLKSPIAINIAEKRAAQLMLEEDYPVRAPLVQQEMLSC